MVSMGHVFAVKYFLQSLTFNLTETEGRWFEGFLIFTLHTNIIYKISLFMFIVYGLVAPKKVKYFLKALHGPWNR